MNCLHLCNDYLGSQVHTNLYKSLEGFGVTQTVFVPLRNERADKFRSGAFFRSDKTRVVFSPQLKPYHKILFGTKIKDLFRSVNSQLNIAEFDIMCASTLYSDGFLAFKLYQQYQTPYIVAVRSVDVDVFMRFRPDLNGLMNKILVHARAIVFISEGLRDKFFNRIGSADRKKWSHKSVVIHNGIDEYWLSNRSTLVRDKPKKFLYVGSLIKRKNVGRVIQAVLNVNKDSQTKLKLGVVGDGGHFSSLVRRYASKHPNMITYYGQVMDKDELRAIYNRYDVFIMPSYRETFGLVYVEALSQGLSLIISKGEGVDGMFDKASIKVDPFSVTSIEEGITKACVGSHGDSPMQIDLQQFSWYKIGNMYFKIFKSVHNAS